MPDAESASARPLTGLRVVELAGLAPVPFLGLLLATYGAAVVRIDRPASIAGPAISTDHLTAHKAGSVPLDLKRAASTAILHCLLATADVLLDPFRPGVLEKLLTSSGGADELLRRHPRLIIVRLTGFRREGKWRNRAGHDINFLAVSGVLALLGGAEDRGPPLPPANLLADFAGGGLSAFAGTLLALLRRSIAPSGKGGIVDVNMVDGSAFLATFARLAKASGTWNAPRGTNILDGGCPYYTCYECKDRGRYVAVGALEPQFFDQLLDGVGLCEADVLGDGATDRLDKSGWAHMRAVFTQRFRERTRDEWERVFEGRDACVTPVKDMEELRAEGDITKIPFHLWDERMVSQLPSDRGQGHPPDGIGWSSGGMEIGHRAGPILQHWLGWEKDKDWTVDGDGAYVRISDPGRSKL